MNSKKVVSFLLSCFLMLEASVPAFAGARSSKPSLDSMIAQIRAAQSENALIQVLDGSFRNYSEAFLNELKNAPEGVVEELWSNSFGKVTYKGLTRLGIQKSQFAEFDQAPARKRLQMIYGEGSRANFLRQMASIVSRMGLEKAKRTLVDRLAWIARQSGFRNASAALTHSLNRSLASGSPFDDKDNRTPLKFLVYGIAVLVEGLFMPVVYFLGGSDGVKDEWSDFNRFWENTFWEGLF